MCRWEGLSKREIKVVNDVSKKRSLRRVGEISKGW